MIHCWFEAKIAVYTINQCTNNFKNTAANPAVIPMRIAPKINIRSFSNSTVSEK